MSVGVARARSLARPIARAIRWSPFVAVAPVAALVMILGRTMDEEPPFADLPAVSLLFAACLGFVLDDPAVEVTTPTPTTRLATRAVRAAVTVPVVAAGWAAALAYADVGSVGVSLTAGFAAQCAVSLGLAAVGVEVVGGPRSGLFAAASLVAVFVIAPIAFDVSLRLEPTSVTWGHRYGRWLLVGAGGVATLALASSAWVARGSLLAGLARRPSRVRVTVG